MGDIEQLRIDLEAAREELLAAVEGISRVAFEREPPQAEDAADRGWSVRDVLWHVGLVEDWIRRTVAQGTEGRPTTAYAHRDRPKIAQTPEYLAEWLDQCRRPLLALLRRLPDDALDRAFTLPDGGSRMPRRMIEHIAAHDREHAAQVRALRARSEGATAGEGEDGD